MHFQLLQPPWNCLEVPLLVVLSSSGAVHSSFEVAQDTAVEPRSHSQTGTFLVLGVHKGMPCCQQQVEEPGRNHWAGEGRDKDRQEEVGHSWS